MVSIADGFEFPQLQKTIEDLWATFNRADEMSAILNEQFDHQDDVARETRIILMAEMLKKEMSSLGDHVFALVELRQLDRAA